MPLFDDSAPITAARVGDADAFAIVHERVFTAAFDFVSRVTGDEQLASETAGHAALAGGRELATGGDPETAAFRIAWKHLEAREFGESETGNGHGPGAALAARREAVLDLHVRRGLDGAALGAVLGVSARSGEVVARQATRRAGRARNAGAHDGASELDANAPRHVITPSAEAVSTSLAAATSAWREALSSITDDPPGDPPRDTADGSLSPGRKRFALLVALLLAATGAAIAALVLVPASPLALSRDPSEMEGEAPLGPSETADEAAPTPSRTATRTPSPAPSLQAVMGETPSATVSPTAMASPSVGVSPSPGTPVPSGALTPTGTVTPTQTPMPPATPTPSVTPALSPTPMATATATATATPTPTATLTLTATATACAGTISAQVSRLSLTPGGATFFPVFASFCRRVTVLAGKDASWIAVNPVEVPIEPGGFQYITVLVSEDALPGDEGLVTVTAPANTLEIVVTVVAPN